jgi:hypothetical protein
MGWVARPGPMVRSTVGSMSLGLSLGLGSSDGRMAVDLLVILRKMRSMVQGSILGAMDVAMRGNGLTTKCTVKANSHGPTSACTLATTLMTKRKVTVYLRGPTARNIRENGSTGSSMERENIPPPPKRNDMDFGKMVDELLG